ncbi:tRNA lysidine(34) synthetase TilS [Agaribacterium haliotis]|uniref:tRNA lysidine(34) synthetase TilS n=1 Tax=Agaribacterium haliotis TaxID=2013869 RepID=UPI000BB58931|nr:tRNA lysidine(34) synthetase TilS [Agaribacterium haliotis]
MQFGSDSLQKFSACTEAGGRLYVGYSGGLDSSVLLELLARSEFAARVVAVHINHGLSAHADLWQRHCERRCAELGIVFQNYRLAISGTHNLESRARRERYSCFKKSLSPGDLLLLAHHADDQSETLLQRLARGAGLRGMVAAPRQRQLRVSGGVANLYRPLLNTSRAALEAWAQTAGLSWVEDDSNTCVDFDRNFLRLQVLPLIKQRWPHFASACARSAENLAGDLALLQAYLKADLERCDLRNERLGQSLDLGVFLQFEPAKQAALLRLWLAECGQPAPNQRRLAQFYTVLAAAADAQPRLLLGEYELRRFNGRLYLLPKLDAVTSDYSVTWTAQKPLSLADGSRLFLLGADSHLAKPRLEVVYRRPGLRCKPVNRQHSQSLKKLLQEYQLEPWLRDRVPLVFFEQQLIAVADLWLCENTVMNESVSFCWSYGEVDSDVGSDSDTDAGTELD